MREVWGSRLRFAVSGLVLLTNKEPKEVVNRHAEQYVYNITLDHSRIWKARGEWDITLSLHIAKPHQCNTLFKISLNFFFFLKGKNLITFSPQTKLLCQTTWNMNMAWSTSNWFSSVRLWYHRAFSLVKHFTLSSSSPPPSPALHELKSQSFQYEWRQQYD